MKPDQVFGFLIILLAIYLGINANGNQNTGGTSGGSGSGIFDGGGGSTTGGSGVGSGGSADGGGSGTGSGGGGGSGGGSGSGGGGSGGGQSGQRSQERVVAQSDFCAGAPASSTFTDIGSAHDEAIRCMDAAGVMNGTSTTTFAPGDALTRGQAAEAIAAMIDTADDLEADGADLRPLPDAEDPRFVDVPTDAPHALAIARLNETPVLQGYVDARFEPSGRVTRAQMASMLDRAYQYMNRAALPIGPDAFRDDERSVHEESINAVAAAEIMPGVSDRRFAPNRSVTRGETASYLARIMIRMEDKGRITPLP